MNEVLGEGTYGKVTLVEVDGKPKAFKEYGKYVSWSEIDIATNYSHPNIIEGGYYSKKGVEGLLMEIGSDVYPKSKNEMIDFIEQSSQGLQFLHSRGVLHCDIKTTNFVKVGSKYKYIDFGNALITSPERCREGMKLPTLKYTTTFVAPEAERLFMGGYDDEWQTFASTKTDVFALAISWLWTKASLTNMVDDEADDLYELYLEDHTNNIIPQEKAVENYATLVYYFHWIYLQSHETRMRFVGRILEDYDLPVYILEVISDMLAWDHKERPDMDQVLERLNVEKVPGTFSVYLPETLKPVYEDALLKSYTETGYGSLDVEDLFRAKDILMRIGAVSDVQLNAAVFWYSANRSIDEIVVNGLSMPIPDISLSSLFQRLNGSMGSCNIFYRLANGLDALKYLYGVNDTSLDVYKLKAYIEENFTPSSKTITIEEFGNVL